jgi:L-2-hydroxyglutarate oxidase LhgO
VHEAEVVVIGAGVVGLASAAALSREGRDVWVIEAEAGPGRVTSSRNSGVVHAGIYYPPGSLKAQSCVEGRALTYDRAERLGLPHQKTGKLIVAVEAAERPGLEQIAARAEAAGVPLEWLDAEALRAREPLLRGVAALLSPESGVVDAHALVESYRAEAASHGADFVFHTRVVGLAPAGDALRVSTENDRGERLDVVARWVVNAAGLGADHVAALAGVDVDARGYRLHPCKGDYFALASSAPRPQTALVYPVPSGPGLGVHLTVDLGGRCVAGPDATFVTRRDDYAVDEQKREAFAASVARYLPSITIEHLSPDYAGIRPRLAGPGEPFRDFVLERDPEVEGLIHLIGIESPGLTAAPDLARRVAALIA